MFWDSLIDAAISQFNFLLCADWFFFILQNDQTLSWALFTGHRWTRFGKEVFEFFRKYFSIFYILLLVEADFGIQCKAQLYLVKNWKPLASMSVWIVLFVFDWRFFWAGIVNYCLTNFKVGRKTDTSGCRSRQNIIKCHLFPEMRIIKSKL